MINIDELILSIKEISMSFGVSLDSQPVATVKTDAVALRGEVISEWLIHPATWAAVCAALDASRDDRTSAALAASLRGVGAHGALVCPSAQEVAALPVRVGRALQAAVAQHTTVETPEIISGDGIGLPALVRLGDHFVSFHPKTVGHLERLAYGGSLMETAYALADISDCDDLLDWLPSGAGWYLLDQLKDPIVTAAKPMLEAVNASEFRSGVSMSDMPISLAVNKINAYAREYNSQLKFQAGVAGARLKSMH